MKAYRALVLLAVGIAVSTLDGVALAGEKQVLDIKELAGSWSGWVTAETGRQERANMTVTDDGSYKAATTGGSFAEGKFYLHNGKLHYQSSRTTGTASLSEDGGKTTLTVTPMDPNYQTGKAEYERLR